MDSPLTSLGPTPISGSPAQPGRRDDSIGEGSLIALKTPLGARKISQHREQQALRLTIDTTDKTHVLLPGNKLVDTDLKIEVFFNGKLSYVDFINTKRVGQNKNSKIIVEGTRIHCAIEKRWVYLQGGASSQSPFTAEERWDGIARLLSEEAVMRGVDEWDCRPPTAEFLNELSKIALPEHLTETAHLGTIDVLISTGNGSKYEAVKGFISEPKRMDSAKFQTQVPVAQHAGKALSVVLPDTGASSVENNTLATASRESTVPVSNTASLDDPFSDLPSNNDSGTQHLVSSSSPKATDMILSTSSDVPLAQRTRTPSLKLKNSFSSPKATPPADSLDALQKDLAANQNASLFVKDYMTNRGKPGKSRPLPVRLGDIKQMDPGNREKAIQKLRAELGLPPPAPKSSAEIVAAFRKDMASIPGSESWVLKPFTNSRGKQREATVEERLSHIKNMTPNNSLKAIQLLREEFGMEKTSTPNETTPPRSSEKPVTPGAVMNTVENDDADMEDAPHELDPHFDVDQASMLAQARTDLAIDFGAFPNGRLVDRIASMSPRRTPTKKTPNTTPSRDSPAPRNSTSLAATPDSSRRSNKSRTKPLTLSLRRDSTVLAQKPCRSSTSEQLKVSPKQPPEAQKIDKGPPPKKKAKYKMSMPEQTEKEALMAFMIPELCQGSAISYAPGHQKVTKCRPGAFEEEQVVVGMRFVLV